MRTPAAVVCAVSLAVAACSDDLLGPDFEHDFDLQGGCGDVYFFAVDARDEVLLTFHTPGLVAATVPPGTTERAFDLPHPDVVLTVEVGSRISDAICDDVIENGGPRVRRSYRAVAGTAAVTIRRESDAFGARGDLLLQDVVLRDEDGNGVTLDRLEWIDTAVGWFPG